jgi:hypothetical protein
MKDMRHEHGYETQKNSSTLKTLLNLYCPWTSLQIAFHDKPKLNLTLIPIGTTLKKAFDTSKLAYCHAYCLLCILTKV